MHGIKCSPAVGFRKLLDVMNETITLDENLIFVLNRLCTIFRPRLTAWTWIWNGQISFKKKLYFVKTRTSRKLSDYKCGLRQLTVTHILLTTAS